MSLNEQQASELWRDVRGTLWPSVRDANLTGRQRADVSQLYFHTIANSLITDAVYITGDNNFLSRADEIYAKFGVVTDTATATWTQYAPKYGLYQPTDIELSTFLHDQRNHLLQMSNRSQ